MDKEIIKKSIYNILVAIGEDPEREGLKETPDRVANMYEEIFCGINSDAKSCLKLFHEQSVDNEVVLMRDIPFYSMCEHHLLPFFGVVDIAYIPNDGSIVGLSKLSRIVDCYARRPQVQERLTYQISEFLFSNMKVKCVGVAIKAEHLCMTMRGAKSIGSKTITNVFRSQVENDDSLRQRVMGMLIGEGNK